MCSTNVVNSVLKWQPTAPGEQVGSWRVCADSQQPETQVRYCLLRIREFVILTMQVSM